MLLAGLRPCREINRGGLLLIYQILVDTAQADIAKALQVLGGHGGLILRGVEAQQPCRGLFSSSARFAALQASLGCSPLCADHDGCTGGTPALSVLLQVGQRPHRADGGAGAGGVRRKRGGDCGRLHKVGTDLQLAPPACPPYGRSAQSALKFVLLHVI